MASTFTTNAHIELQGTGDNSGTWGSVLNTAALTIIDNVLGGTQTISLGAVNVTLTTTQSQSNAIFLTGTLTANVSVTFPSIGRTYFIANNCTGNFTVTIRTASAGVTQTIPTGASGFYVLSGANVSIPTQPGPPIASVTMFAGNFGSQIPPGWLYCNGAAVSRTTYAGLFSIINTIFGPGDGVTTFNLPDMRAMFGRGWDDSRGIDPGRIFGSTQNTQNLQHAHSGTTASAGSHSHTTTLNVAIGYDGPAFPVWGNGDFSSNPQAVATSTDGLHTHTFNTNNSGGTESRPYNVAMLYIIRAF